MAPFAVDLAVGALGARVMPNGNVLAGSAPFAATDVARRTRAQREFSCACWAVVSWTTFLGLQFQMDCVGSVSFLS